MFEKMAGLYYKWRLKYRYERRKKMAQKSPERFVKKLYRDVFAEEPNFDHPQTFNEKINWMKLYWYDERAQICSDKFLVRDYVKGKGLEKILIDLIAVYDTPAQIDFDNLPERFVLKATHDSGNPIICVDKSKFDEEEAIKRLKNCLKVDYEYMGGEWPYASSKKRIVCEKYMEDEKAGELYDYKFFCFNGEPVMIFFCTDRAHHVKSDFYDLDWNLLPFRWEYEPSGKIYPRPSQLDAMIAYARSLAQDFPFVRVDLYQIGEKVYFGELTFFHGCGLGRFQPKERDYLYGSMITLPPKKDPWKEIQTCRIQ